MPNQNLIVNGVATTVDLPDDFTMLWALRDVLGVTGPKFGCGVGVCGACTSHIGTQHDAFRPCMHSVAECRDQPVTTIEGLATGEVLHPVQQAWIDLDVAQCGYCQPGQIMTAVALIARNPNPSDAEIDAAMSENVCRCGTYVRIRAAIKKAAADIRGG